MKIVVPDFGAGSYLNRAKTAQVWMESTWLKNFDNLRISKQKYEGINLAGDVDQFLMQAPELLSNGSSERKIDLHLLQFVHLEIVNSAMDPKTKFYPDRKSRFYKLFRHLDENLFVKKHHEFQPFITHQLLLTMFSELLHRGNVVSAEVMKVRDRLTVSINQSLRDILGVNSHRVFGNSLEWHNLTACNTYNSAGTEIEKNPFDPTTASLFSITTNFIRLYTRYEIHEGNLINFPRSTDRIMEWTRVFRNVQQSLYHLLWTEYQNLTRDYPEAYQQLLLGTIRTMVVRPALRDAHRRLIENSLSRGVARKWQNRALDDTRSRWFDNLVVDLPKYMTVEDRELAKQLCRTGSIRAKQELIKDLMERINLTTNAQQIVREIGEWTDTQLCAFLGILVRDAAEQTIACKDDPLNVYEKTTDLLIHLLNNHPKKFVTFYRANMLTSVDNDWLAAIDTTNPNYYQLVKRTLKYHLRNQRIRTLCDWDRQVRELLQFS